MRILKKTLINFLTLTLLWEVAIGETANDLKREWQSWRIQILKLEDEIEWDGTTYEIAIPEDSEDRKSVV